MAGIQWSWTKALIVVALGFAGTAGRVAVAQASAASSGGAIAGKLTDLRSAPLAGATVVVRNESTGAETRTTTARNGSYRFTGLDPGEYTLEAESEQLEGCCRALTRQARNAAGDGPKRSRDSIRSTFTAAVEVMP
jgi:Carboxypeptidase regulatory-like domain